MTAKAVLEALGITALHKGSRAVYTEAINRELRAGRIVRDSGGFLRIGDLSSLALRRNGTPSCPSVYEEAIRRFLADNPESTITEICDAVGCVPTTARRALRRMGTHCVQQGKTYLWG